MKVVGPSCIVQYKVYVHVENGFSIKLKGHTYTYVVVKAIMMSCDVIK